jgi:hypothetical protein
MTDLTLIERFPVILNMLNAIKYIKIQAEVKFNDKYVPASQDTRINQILTRDGSDFLSRMYFNYIVHGQSLAYKAKTIRAAMADSDGNPIYDYKDGAVSGLHVLDSDLWTLDENAQTGAIDGAYINKSRDSVVGSRNYLKRHEFIYSTDWAPEGKPRHSIGWFIEHTAEPVSAVLGVDNDLMAERDGQSTDRRDALIKRAMQDTIIPAASKFTRDLQSDLGLPNEIRLVLNAGDMEVWTRAWDGITNRLPNDVIIQV